MRVESDRPTRNGGWLHKSDDYVPYIPPPKAIVEPKPDLNGLWRRWSSQTDHYFLDGFAMSLGVDTDALGSIGCAWADRAWAFPMKDADERMIGIRFRNEAGQKWAVTGSKQGLFVSEREPERVAYIVEGPTDCAAALTLGLYAIGRPSCMGQEEMLAELLRNKKVRRAVIISDNDTPGLQGARTLQAALKMSTCIWVPPAKDLREFVRRGGEREIIESSIKDLVWAA